MNYLPTYDHPTLDADQLESIGHWLCRLAGLHIKSEDEHPFAIKLAREFKRPGGLRSILALYGTRAGMSTYDFATLMANGSKILVAKAYQNIAGLIDPLVRDYPVNDFRSQTVSHIRLTDDPVVTESNPIDEGTRPTAPKWTTQSGTVAPKSYGFYVPISRQILINDDIQLVVELLAAAAARLGQLPAVSLADLINNNATVEGAALCDTDNTVSGGATATGLGAAIAKLERAHYVPAGRWLVPPDQRVAAGTVLESAGLREQITLSSLPWLTSTSYSYLMPAPETLPVFCRAGIRRNPPVADIRYQHQPADSLFIGQCYFVNVEYAVTATSRALVRIGS